MENIKKPTKKNWLFIKFYFFYIVHYAVIYNEEGS